MGRQSLLVIWVALVIATTASVGGTVEVLSPNGGETITAGTDLAVNWIADASLKEAQVAIFLRDLSDNAGSVTGLIEGTAGTEFQAGDGTATFRVPGWIGDGGDYVVDIWVIPPVVSFPSILAHDSSDAPFSITGSLESIRLAIEHPAAGSVLTAGEPALIKWQTPPNGVMVLPIFQGMAGVGAPVVGPVSMPNRGVVWDVPTNIGNGDDFFILGITIDHERVLRFGGTYPFDMAGPFAIAGSDPRSFIEITSPEPGAMLNAGEQTNICWNTDLTSGIVRFNITDGLAVTSFQRSNIGSSAVTSGCRTWTPCASLSGNDFHIVASVQLNNGLFLTDVQEESFSIMPSSPRTPVTITHPSGGENLIPGFAHSISWDAPDDLLGSQVGVSLLADTPKGLVETPLGNSNAVTCGGTGDYCGELETMLCPHFEPDTEYRISVCVQQAIGCIEICSVSEPFHITEPLAPTNIELTHPVGGEFWTTGQQQTITWNATGLLNRTVEVHFSGVGNDGVGPMLGTALVSDGSFDYTPPAVPTFNGNTFSIFLDVVDENGCVVDRSASDAITITGSVLGDGVCESQEFVWNSPDCDATHDFDQSGVVDLADHDAFVMCATSPCHPFPSPGCEAFDVDGDRDVDFADWAGFQQALEN